MLTAATFFKLREVYFGDHVDDNEYSGRLYGLGSTVAALSSVVNGTYDAGGVGTLGMGLGPMGMAGMSMRSGATIAERERTPLPRESLPAQGLQGQGVQNQGVGVQGGIPTPGLGGFPPALTPYGMAAGTYLRQLGAER